MTWKKRETAGEITKLGDAEGHVKRALGRLVATRDGKYDNRLFVLEQEDGSVITVAGNNMLEEQVHENDIGKFVRMEFDGWATAEKSGNQYKKIYAYFWEGELNDRMKAWGGTSESVPDEPEDEDDGGEPLPF
jgi:hypothetical protein